MFFVPHAVEIGGSAYGSGSSTANIDRSQIVAVNENLMELAQRIDTAVVQKDEYALLLLISGCEASLEVASSDLLPENWSI